MRGERRLRGEAGQSAERLHAAARFARAVGRLASRGLEEARRGVRPGQEQDHEVIRGDESGGTGGRRRRILPKN